MEWGEGVVGAQGIRTFANYCCSTSLKLHSSRTQKSEVTMKVKEVIKLLCHSEVRDITFEDLESKVKFLHSAPL